MIIGIDASRANLTHKTGPEWYSYYLIRWLAKLDSKNEYILYSNKPLTGGLIDLTTEQYYEKEDNVDEIQYDKQGYQKIKSPHGNFKVKILKWPFKYCWTQGRMSLEMIFKRPDVLFVPAHVLPIIHPRKSIVTIHDVGYKEQNHYEESLVKSFSLKRKCLFNILIRAITLGKYRVSTNDYLRWTTQHALKRAKKIIVASNFTKLDISQKFKSNLDKITVIPQGYNKFLYKKINDQEKIQGVLNKYGIEGPFIFYIGRIERKKNIPTLIESFAIMREKNKHLKHKLVMVGDASIGYDEINYMIREFDLTDEVIMPGWVKETDIPCFYNGADLFVFPSNYEGFGIPLLQAMACEVPITASNVTAIPEIVQRAALLFNPQYALSISDTMAQVLNNNDVSNKLKSYGRERVKNFSWKKTAEITFREIRNL